MPTARTPPAAGRLGPVDQLGVQPGVGEGDGGTVAVGVGLGWPVTMAKSTSEISKKMLPTAPILIRAVCVGMFGITMVSEPSLGVLLTRTVGKALPPST